MLFRSISAIPIQRLSLLLAFAFVLLLFTPGKASAIVNGEKTAEGEQPWMVGIAQADVDDGYTAQFCGGALISPEWVLTAAHCTYNENGIAFNASDLDVIVGRQQLSSMKGERIRIDQIVRNEQYDAATYRNDIALLHLSRPAHGTPVRVSATTRTDLEQPSLTVTVAGWGITADGQPTDTLQRAELPLVNQTVCQAAYTPLGLTISADTLCAGYADGGVDACTGDSGGPLVVWDKQTGSWVQIGIVSWGEGCAQRGLFGVYTRVASFTTWILHTTHIDTGVNVVSSLNVTHGS